MLRRLISPAASADIIVPDAVDMPLMGVCATIVLTEQTSGRGTRVAVHTASAAAQCCSGLAFIQTRLLQLCLTMYSSFHDAGVHSLVPAK